MRFAVLAACRNRLETTRNFVEFWSAHESRDDSFQLIILDDGSTDGTVEMLSTRDGIKLVPGDGSYYWNGAMAALVEIALKDDFDALILANDDIDLFDGVIEETFDLFKLLNAERPTALVGAFQAGDGSKTTFGGLARKSLRSPLALKIVTPHPPFAECDTFHGNFVIIPSSALRQIGGMKKVYQHAFGDLDLGFRLSSAGIRLAVTPKHIGVCDPGPSLEDRTRGKTMKERLTIAFGRHRSPQDYRTFMFAHAPWLAPFGVLKDTAARLRLGFFGAK